MSRQGEQVLGISGFGQTRHFALCLLLMSLALNLPSTQGAESSNAKTTADEQLLFAEIPVVYAAARHYQPVSEAPAAVNVITREDIRKFHYRTLGQALSSVPGLYLTNDREYEHVGARGLGIPGDFNVRVLFLLNGLPLNDKYFGAFVPELVPDLIDAVERIEVVKGPASALFGNSAVFATVNIVTRKGSDLDGHGVVSAEAGSDPFGRGVFTYGNRLKNGLDLFFSGHYEINRGERDIDFGKSGTAHDQDDQQLSDAYLSARYQDFFLQAWYGDRKKDFPGIPFDLDDGWVRDAWSVVELRWEKPIDDDKRLMMRTYYEDYAYSASLNYPDDPIFKRNFERTDDKWIGYEAQFNWTPIEQHTLTLGAVVEHHWTRLRGHFDTVSDRRSYTYPGTGEDFSYDAVYVQDEWRIMKPLTLTASVRYDAFPDSEQDRFSPRAALVWNATDRTTVKAIYGEAFRAPSEFEASYAKGSGFGIRNLPSPETIHTWELVLEQDFRQGLFGRVSAFHNEVEDLIALTEDSSGMTYYNNLYNVRTTGVEVEVNKRFANGVRGFVNGTFQDSFSSDRRLINSPIWIANFGLVWPIFGDKLAFSIRENYVSDRQTGAAGVKTGDNFLTDLTISSENALPNWSFFFSVLNLLDTRNTVPLGADSVIDRVPQPGRAFVLRASYRF